MRIYLTILLTFSIASSLLANQMTYNDGEVMVRIDPDADIQQIANDLTWILGINAETKVKKLVAKQMDIWLLEFDHTKVQNRHFLNIAKAHPRILTAQFNHKLTRRGTVPNDPEFIKQWHWLNDGQTGGTADADVDAEEAWDLATGGLTANGDTIVVAVIDDGANFNHSDLASNYWFNHAEIPNNGIDDDQNGYVDDYRGWNNQSNNDNVTGGSHGVSVAGMIGGIGDNNDEGCGINWNVKIMTITGDYVNEAGAISAYSYALTQRQIYNQTNGASGAFVVATNSSWGIDGGDPASAPLWCAFYDTLGVHGILSCGATANNNVNIDVVGDLPTACASEYMIAVTATNHDDVRTFSGYGATTIDLGAPGEDVYTAAGSGGYAATSGTSFASPLVSGIIALLYSAPCNTIANQAISSPEIAAQNVRDYIFQGVDKIPILTNETVYGGRANAFNSIQLLLQNCGPCPPPYALQAKNITDTDATLTWIPGDSTLVSNLEWRDVTASTWTVVPNASSPYNLTNLTPCTEYEFRLQAECANDTSDYSLEILFKTDGCCEPPLSLTATNNVTDTTAELTWSSVLAASSYNLRWREAGGATWTTITGATSPFNLTMLTACTSYEFEVQTICMNGNTTAWSSTIPFSSSCGACTANSYCASSASDSSYEWIEEVEVNGVSNVSGDNGGYAGFFEAPIDLKQNDSTNFTLTPGFGSTVYDEYWMIYIDYNQDGTFDATELAFDPGVTFSTPITDFLIVPATANLGLTRMRVIMRYNNAVASPCEDGFDYGEVEDYCVNILAGCETPFGLSANTSGTPGTAVLDWNLNPNAIDYNLRYRPVGTTFWIDLPTIGMPPYTLTNIPNCVDQEFQVQSICQNETSLFSVSEQFSSCVSNNNSLEGITNLYVPNPFDREISVFMNVDELTEVQLDLVNISGQVLESKTVNITSTGQQLFKLNTRQDYPVGIYFLSLKTNKGTGVVKLLKN